MAFAAAAGLGLRQQVSRTSSNPLLVSSSSLRHHHHHLHRQRRRPFLLLATLSFHSLSSHFPPPLARHPSLSAAGSRLLLSAPASASSPATRAPPPSRRVSEEDGEEGQEDEDEGEEVFDVASYDDDVLDDDEDEEGEEDMEEQGAEEDPEFHGQMDGLESESPAPQGQQLPKFPSPKLSVKEKKELASYAHRLGTKLKSQQVGKSGITPTVVDAFVEALEANELLKLKLHGSCPGELPEVIKQLEESTGSVAVSRIGRSVILYRPSLGKMQKKETQVVKKMWRPKPREPGGGLKLQKKRPVQRLSTRRSRSSATRI